MLPIKIENTKRAELKSCKSLFKPILVPKTPKMIWRAVSVNCIKRKCRWLGWEMCVLHYLTISNMNQHNVRQTFFPSNLGCGLLKHSSKWGSSCCRSLRYQTVRSLPEFSGRLQRSEVYSFQVPGFSLWPAAYLYLSVCWLSALPKMQWLASVFATKPVFSSGERVPAAPRW